MKQFVATRQELYDRVIQQALAARRLIVIATAFTHTAEYCRVQLIKQLPHGEIAMQGINQLILKNGSRIYINSAADTSLLGMKPNLIAIDEVYHLNGVHLASFIGNGVKVACDVIVTDEKVTERVKTLRVFEFEGV